MWFDVGEEVEEERIRDRTGGLGMGLSNEDGIGRKELGIQLLIRNALAERATVRWMQGAFAEQETGLLIHNALVGPETELLIHIHVYLVKVLVVYCRGRFWDSATENCLVSVALNASRQLYLGRNMLGRACERVSILFLVGVKDSVCDLEFSPWAGNFRRVPERNWKENGQ